MEEKTSGLEGLAGSNKGSIGRTMLKYFGGNAIASTATAHYFMNPGLVTNLSVENAVTGIALATGLKLLYDGVKEIYFY